MLADKSRGSSLLGAEAEWFEPSLQFRFLPHHMTGEGIDGSGTDGNDTVHHLLSNAEIQHSHHSRCWLNEGGL